MAASIPRPLRAGGTRVRAGNAMDRTRAAILAAARDVIVARGVRATTMAEVAAVAGVAKATVYNHFRARADLFMALAEDFALAVGASLAATDGAGLERGLKHAADLIAQDSVVRRARLDPAVLVVLATPTEDCPWDLLRAALDSTLAVTQSAGASDVVLRWLVSHVTDPGTSQSRTAAARILAETVHHASKEGALHSKASKQGHLPSV